jgi:hypothetical protein
VKKNKEKEETNKNNKHTRKRRKRKRRKKNNKHNTPSRTIAWTPLAYLSHIKRRSNDDRFLVSQWETLIFSSLGVTTPALLGPSQQWV